MSAAATHPTTADWARAAFEAFPEALITLDAQRRVVYWNPTAEALTGRSSTLMQGQLLDEAIPERLHARVRQRFEKIRQKLPMDAASFEGRLLHADGTVIPVSATLVPTWIAEQFRLHLLVRDIRARHEAQRHARELLAHHELLLRAIESIVVSIDSQSRITKWNHAAEKILGIPEPMALGRRFDALDLEWPADRIRDAIAATCEHRELVRLDDVPFRKSDGNPRVLGLVVRALQPDGEFAGCLITGADITSRRSLETQLQRAERLESIGRLAAGIAHEINTPIQFVGDNLRFLADGLQDLDSFCKQSREMLDAAGADPTGKVSALEEELEIDYLQEELPRAITQSLEGVGRVARIVRAMKELSHPASDGMAPADINQAIESATIITKNEWKYCARLELELEPSLPNPTCLINELSQVFLNLIVNAAHAITARWGQDSEQGLIGVRALVADDHIEVRVSDNGTGMSDEVRAKCFDPFFTTKEVGRGTGQGLAITHAIVVDHHGGEVDLETEKGKGTTMILRIPLEPKNGSEGNR